MDKVIVKSWSWRGEIVALPLRVGRWALLALWLQHGIAGAGNLLQAWIAVGFLAALFSWLVAMRPLRVLHEARPRWMARLWFAETVLFCVALAWAGCWWLLAASLFILFTGFMWRGVNDKALSEREVACG